MIMYETSKYACEVTAVEVERKTEKSVFIKGNRRAISSDWNKYHDTFEDAKKYLLEVASRKIESAKFNLECAESFLDKVKYQLAAKEQS